MYCYLGKRFKIIAVSSLLFVSAFIFVVNLPVYALEQNFQKTSSTDLIDKASQSHAQINVLRREDPIDMDAIESLYTNDIQPLVQEVDVNNDFALDADILQAIEDMKNQVDTALAAQVVDKTIRRVFFIMALSRANKVKDEFGQLTTAELNKLWDEGFAAFDSVDGTVGQTAKVLSVDKLFILDSSDPGLNDNVIRAFINGQDAINKDSLSQDDGGSDADLTRIKVQRQIIRFTMERGFYLIVLKEVKGALEKRDDNPDGAKVNQKEGEVLHRAIASKVARDNPEGNVIIEDQLSGPLEGIVAETLIKEYSKAWMAGTIRELDGNSGAMRDGDIPKAIETAHEGILFASMFIDDLEQRLGKDLRDTVTRTFGNLILSSAKGSVDDALEQRNILREILEQYEENL